ncbi:HNH endonuclease [Ralstonia holmesii]|uniref:HNH endonuclease n=1 Tax=Ralstonia holmesii TaxID=3058602 RepID=UPI0028F611AC|nr:HNH endonuclease signature motif containing protein [Ralstonia sp. LMG 32967]CAJ0698666.1 hypothetical protein R11007_02855 [Ralstonia sp. LMG 32967]
MNAEAIKKASAKFRAFLTERGAEVLKPTSEWELIRFNCAAGVAIVYTDARGRTTFTGEALAAWNAFCTSGAWSAGNAVKRKRLSPVIQTLVDRDGECCFYCWKPLQHLDLSVEHIVPVAHGGPNHISNLVLAHRSCNAAAGHLSAMEKILRRERAKPTGA